MKRFLKHGFALVGFGIAIGLSLFVTAITDGMGNVDDEINALWTVVGVGVVGYFISGFMQKLGGVLMILSGVGLLGLFEKLGFLATIPLVIAGVISFTIKKKQSSVA